MSCSASALDLRPDATNAHASSDESGEHAAPDTRRLKPFELEAVLRSSETWASDGGEHGEEEDDPEPTLMVSPADKLRLLTQAFRESAADDITLDAPAPAAQVTSPLCGSGAAREPAAHGPREVRATDLASLFDETESVRGNDATPDVPLLAPEALIERVSGGSGIRPRYTADHVLEAREAARRIREEDAKTRLIVVGIWGAAVSMAGLLGYFALTT